ncbi:MAG: hypothetical protein AMXMBFR84_03240 [Candidatus Hydrogenedentota bacterium]
MTHAFHFVRPFTAICILAALPCAHAVDEKSAYFELEIRPLLAKHCFECHGEEKQKSELRLDTPEGLLKGGTRGPAVMPGDANSLLLEVVNYLGDVQMPPAGKLPQQDIDKLTAWVSAGAVWPKYASDAAPTGGTDKAEALAQAKSTHWAYRPLASPQPPAITNAAWPHNDIDRFLLAGMEKEGLQPAAPADKRTLIRRVTFNLTGLPPSVDEVNAFLADESPEAFSTLIDRLLASPRYGERWGRHWLDVVRYTDSFDSRASIVTDPAEIWRYRDWVVNAFNRDMPYDQFLQYQIAGDVLPGPDGGFNREGLIATGMLAIGNWPQGDADKEKMVSDIVDDQIDVITRGMLGITMACARCHDHKFDPFTTEEYYGMAGVFFSSSILPGPGAKTEGSPILHLPIASKEDLAAREARAAHEKALRDEHAALLLQERTTWAQAEAAKTAQYLLATTSDASEAAGLNAEALRRWLRFTNQGVHPALNTVDRDLQGKPGLFARRDAVDLPSSVANTSGEEYRYATIIHPAGALAVHPSPDQGVGIVWRSPVQTNVHVTGRVADADATCGDGIRWTLEHRGRGIAEIVAQGDMPNGGEVPIQVASTLSVSSGDQLVLTVLPNNGHGCDTTLVSLNVQSDGSDTWDLVSDVLKHFAEGNPWPDVTGRPDVWWLHAGEAGPRADPILFAPWWKALEEMQAGRRGPDALQQAAAMIQTAIDGVTPESPLATAIAAVTGDNGPFWIDPQPAQEGSRRAVIESELASLEAQPLPELELAVGIQEGGVPGTPTEGIRNTRVHRRGDYNNLGDEVPRAMPAVVREVPRPVTAGSGRADMAKWVTEDCAALTARVMVNRIWQHHFGEGLVRTPGDFGKQGEPPTHPELLDYLANQFIESGWSIKSLHRAILNTAAYQQSSQADATVTSRDPENKWLARNSRRRLDAEALRDSLLYVAGVLDLTPGGPAYADMNIPRRTLYLRTVRSNLSTYTMLFDGADPTSVVPKRAESIVSPQALFLLNNEFIAKLADALAKSVESQGADLPALVDVLYQRLYARPATPKDIEIAQRLLTGLGYPASESLVAYAQVLVSANEFMFVD